MKACEHKGLREGSLNRIQGNRGGQGAEGDGQSYDDIIGLPRHVSETRPQMPISVRAAQFAPFAALTGFEEAIRKAQEDFASEEAAT